MHVDWWTLALQTVNVLVLIWILARFFFRPIAAIVAKRRQEIAQQLAEAEAASRQAAELRKQAEASRAELVTERDRLLAQARTLAQAEKLKLLDEAAQDAAKLRRQAEAAIARDAAAAEQQVVNHAATLSLDIARRLLERLPANLGFETFLTALCDEIAKLAPATRHAFMSAGSTARPIEVVTRASLNDKQRTLVRDALKDAFGADLPLTYRNDPGVLGGIELHGHNVILHNSWRSDLDRIREELSGERHPSES